MKRDRHTNIMMKVSGGLLTFVSRCFFSGVLLKKARTLLLNDPWFQKKDIVNLLNQVSFSIHPLDSMLRLGAADHYLKVGLSAISCIDKALKLTIKPEIKSVLDFPCGYGRVLRFMVKRFPEAYFLACDIDRKAIRFCSKSFSASPLISQNDFSRFSLDQKFDLIWCGSLITHLDEKSVVELFDFLRKHLNSKGICLFTTHGNYSYQRMQNEKNCYGLTKSKTDYVISEFLNKGFGYAEYTKFGKNCGTSLTSPSWIREKTSKIGGWSEIFFEERGWDEHHDVYAYIAS